MSTPRNATQTKVNKSQQNSTLCKKDQLTHCQHRFLAELPFCQSEAEAARKVGVDRTTAWGWKQDPVFVDALERTREANLAASRERLVDGLAKAIEAILGLLDSKNPNIRLKAALAVLDRAGLGPEAGVGFSISPQLAELLERAKEE